MVLVRRHKRRRAIAALLQALLDQPPPGTIDVAGDTASTPEDDEVEVEVEVEAVGRGAAGRVGRVGRLYLPTSSPWLTPIEMLWRHCRREVTPCALFGTVKALLAAARAFFDRYHQCPDAVRSIIGAYPAKAA